MNNVILNKFEKVCSNFLLILFVSKGIKIDNNILKQIRLENTDYIAININYKILINTILDSKVFEYLKNFDGEFINELKSKIDLLRQKYFLNIILHFIMNF